MENDEDEKRKRLFKTLLERERDSDKDEVE